MRTLSLFAIGGAVIAVLCVIIFLAVFLPNVPLVIGRNYKAVIAEGDDMPLPIGDQTVIEVSVEGQDVPETLLYKYDLSGGDAVDDVMDEYMEVVVESGVIRTSFTTEELSGNPAVLVVTDGNFVYTVDITDAIPIDDSLSD
jgi:hypothetical protein